MKKILFLITLCLCFATVKAQDTTSCEKAFYEYDVNVYPNPCTDYVMIEIGDCNYLEIYDTKGSLIYEYKLNRKRVEVNMSSFENGIYIFRFKNDNYTTTRKVVKARIYEKTN